MEQWESISKGRQAVERVRICHCKVYNGIRANSKQAYAGIADRRKKESHKSR